MPRFSFTIRATGERPLPFQDPMYRSAAEIPALALEAPRFSPPGRPRRTLAGRLRFDPHAREGTEMKWLTLKAWSPYAVGAGIGMLSWFAFLTADTPIGTSTTFVRAVAAAEKAVVPEHVARNPYFAKTGPRLDWQALLVAGL